jgi:hypothetical protein
MKEETGLNILKMKKFNYSGKYKYDKKCSHRNGAIGQTFSLYAVETRMKDVKLDKLEHSEFKWMNFNEAMKKLTWENQRKSLNIVNLWVKTR